MANTFVTFRRKPTILAIGLESHIDFSLVQHQLGWSLYLPDGWTIREESTPNPDFILKIMVDESGEDRGIVDINDATVAIHQKSPIRRELDENTHVIDFPKTLSIHTRADFEKVGFKFEEDEDHLMVVLPEKWSVTSDGMLGQIYDDRGRQRAAILEDDPSKPYLGIQSRFEFETDDDTDAISVVDNANGSYVCTVEVDDVPDTEERYDRAEDLLREYVITLGYQLTEDTWLFDPTAFWE